MLFKDRTDAGQQLAEELLTLADRDDVVILALPRGGVVLGYEISNRLHAPLDLILVRKLGVPWQEELALGAIASNNIRIINKSIVDSLNISSEDIEQIAAREQHELERRNELYRKGKPFPDLKDKIVVIVDDGIATGATVRAAIKVVESFEPKKIIVAVPVASSSVYKEIPDENVQLLVLKTPEPFFGIGMWYGEFSQVTDEQVIDLLTKANQQLRQAKDG